MLSKSQLEYILALHEHQNFVKAAAACFVTQPTLSIQLKKAEELLGKPLFDRDTTPLEMTNYGKKLLPSFRQVLDAYQLLNDEIAKLDGSYKASIKLGIIPTIADYLIPKLYSQWKKELEGVHLEIKELKTEQLITAIEERQIDIGILAGPLNTTSFETQILYHEAIYIYSPLTKSKNISLDELSQLKPWLLAHGNCLRTQMMNFCNLNQLASEDWNYEGGSLSILLHMVNQQGGYTLLPEHYIDLLQLEKTTIKQIKDQQPARQIIAIENYKNAKKPYLQQLKRQVQHIMNTHSPKVIQQMTILPY